MLSDSVSKGGKITSVKAAAAMATVKATSNGEHATKPHGVAPPSFDFLRNRVVAAFAEIARRYRRQTHSQAT
jgi:hypothetical protein